MLTRNGRDTASAGVSMLQGSFGGSIEGVRLAGIVVYVLARYLHGVEGYCA